jgi:hypothetical protein
LITILRKEINKKIVKTEIEIKEVVNLFIKNIKKETLSNIFNYSTKLLKLYLEINTV